jgi:cellulose synthase/poly-beta-1,6-N-acetylglucosamine synthase-like glycosyltransferase
MLSILIPTYNFDCLSFISELQGQCETLKDTFSEFDYEIVVVDDCSTEKGIVESLKTAVSQMGERVRLIALSKNVGRAEVRNILLREARAEWVLLMDSDARVVRHDFVKKYWESRTSANVIVGGILHPSDVERGRELRIAYERSFNKERSLSWRQSHPYAHFSVFNLMARKSVLDKHCFDIRCEEYGYEDFFLGMTLKEAGVEVAHIDNPLLHTGIDTSEDFLKKTETAVRTLSRLPINLRRMSGLEIHALRLKRIHLDRFFLVTFSLIQYAVRKQLLSQTPSILLLQLYKLFYYLRCCEGK